MTSNSPLVRELVTVASDDYSGHVLLTNDDVPLDLEQAVDSLIADGFVPDFGAAWGTLQYQSCGEFSVPIWGTDKTSSRYDEALLNRPEGLLRPAYRLALRVTDGCKIVWIEGYRMQPTTL